MVSEFVLLNKANQPYPTDRICHFGDGLFETIAVVQGKPCLWQRHLERLLQGCERLSIPYVDPTSLVNDVFQLSAEHERAVLKVIVSAGDMQRGYQRSEPVISHYYLQCFPWPNSALYQADTNLHLQLCQTRLGSQPLLAGIKHLNRLEQVLARNELRPDMHEGLMLNQAGQVVEGTMSNLLVRLNGRYLTPPITDCGIAGVVRGLLIEQADMQGESVEIATLSVDQLKQADAVYSMNSLMGIRQIASFDGHFYTDASMPRFLQQISAMCFDPHMSKNQNEN